MLDASGDDGSPPGNAGGGDGCAATATGATDHGTWNLLGTWNLEPVP